MITARAGHVAIPLNGGGVLLAGGSAELKVDAYDPIANAFGESFFLNTSRPGGTFGFPLLVGGRALIGGGATSNFTADYVIP